MTTRRELIMQAVLAALNSDSRPDTAPLATRANAVAASAAGLPKVAVVPIKETIERINRGLTARRTLTLRVECQAAGIVGSEEAADGLLDDIVAWATQALSGNTLGGLVLSLEETSIDWAVEVQDYAYCAAIVDFEATYETDHNDQTRL